MICHKKTEIRGQAKSMFFKKYEFQSAFFENSKSDLDNFLAWQIFLALQKGYFFDVSSTPYDTGVVTNIQESPSIDRVQLYSYK